jgi:hypothetical protein
VLTTGAGGTAEIQGTLVRQTTVEGLGVTAPVAFDTTAARTLGLAVTMSGASASVWAEQRQMIVQAL